LKQFSYFAFMSLFVSGTLEAKELYVNASSGNDSVSYAQNSQSSPWATIGRAAWGSTSRGAPNPGEAARAGDVVHVAAGTYRTVGGGGRYEVAYNPANSGSQGNPIVFQAEGTVTLAYTSGAGPMFGAYGPDYITWRGFTVNEAEALSLPDTGPVVLVDSVGSVIENCTIIGLGNNGRQDNYTGIRIDSSPGTIARGNRIANFLGYGRNSAGIEVYYSGQLTFENNEISNTGSGIFLKAPFNNNDWFIVRYNLIHDVETAGILVHRSPNTPAAPIWIYQNVVRNSGAGIRIFGFDSGATDARNTRMSNNTLVDNTVGMHVVYAMVQGAGHRFWNNLISGGPWAIMIEAPASNFVKANFDSEHNMYSDSRSFGQVGGSDLSLSSWQSTFGQDSASPPTSNQNPQFVNASSYDYRLQSGSPARTGGIDFLDLNKNGNAGDSIPVGAYITGSEIIGPGGTGGGGTPGTGGGSGGGGGSPPAAPTSLRIVP
jgi:hypothetical protein